MATTPEQDQVLAAILAYSGSDGGNTGVPVTEAQLQLVAERILAGNLDMLNKYLGAIYAKTDFSPPLTIDQVQAVIDEANKDLSYLFDNKWAFNDAYVVNWDVSQVENMSYMFTYAEAFNQDISGWNTSQVKDMNHMFEEALRFNQDISGWNTSQVTDMSYMFSAAYRFNQDISHWDISHITDLSFMFENAYFFNQDIGGWDVSNVTNMVSMFEGTRSFNQYIGDWDVSQVDSMTGMFSKAWVFNQDIGNWDVSSVTDMRSMFSTTRAFNQDIGRWDVSNVTVMSSMFAHASAFNQDIGEWEVSKVTYMDLMFYENRVFNQDIGDWDVSNVETMRLMLFRANSFDQDIGDWDISSLISATDMLDGSGMSQLNFDKLLAGWSTLDTAAGETQIRNGVTLGAGGRTYTDATSYHRLDDYYSWNITGATLAAGIIEGTDADEALGESAETAQQIIHALGGNDTLFGGDGADVLVGGAGDDSLTGGDGADRFVYKFSNAGNDVITDFDIDKDILDISQLLIGLNEQNYDLSEHVTIQAANGTDVILTIDHDGFSSGETELVTIRLLNQTFDSNDLNAYLASLKIIRDPKFDALTEILEDSDSGDDYENANGELVTEEQLQEVAERVLAGNATMLTRYRDAIVAETGFSNLPTIEQVQDIIDGENSNLTGLFFEQTDFNDEYVVNWDVSQVTNMHTMFAGAITFNQDIGGWDVSKVTDMRFMFEDATAFDQDIGDWDISSLQFANNMLDNSGMSVENLDKLLAGWSTLDTEAGETVIPMNITLGLKGLSYSDATAADLLHKKYGWILDGAGAAEGVTKGDEDGETIGSSQSNVNQIIHALGGDDIVNGGSGDDFINGGTGDDVIHGNGGNDTIDGYDGYDRVVFAGNRDDYTITDDVGNDWLVTHNETGEASELTNVELLIFDDETVSSGGSELVVTTLDDVVDDDDGVLSLREAIALANLNGDADTISFDESLMDGLIRLNGTELVLTTDITINGDIDGDGKADITISGDSGDDDDPLDSINFTDVLSTPAENLDDNSRVFNITNGTANLNGLNITGGYTGDDGGGILVDYGAELYLENSSIIGNKADGYGGGIENYGATTVTNSTVSYNLAQENGGGIDNFTGTLIIIDSTIERNLAGYGGGVASYDGKTTVINSTFLGNKVGFRLMEGGEDSHGDGGAFYNESGNATFINSTFFANSAFGSGGAMAVESGTVNAIHSTFTENYASQYGGGIFIANAATLKLINSIVLGNYNGIVQEASEEEVFSWGSFINENSILDVDLALVFAEYDFGGVVLADNGGPVMTVALKDDPVNNPAQNQVTSTSNRDARGASRPTDNSADLGAYEVPDGAGEIEILFGSHLDDNIDAGAGNDRVHGGGGCDNMNGGEGNDWLDYTYSTEKVVINLLNRSASGGDAEGDDFRNFEWVMGSAQGDEIIGDAGSNIIRGGAGADIMNGGAGIDWVDYRSSLIGVDVDLSRSLQSGGDAEGDTLTGFERILGSSHDDMLSGDDGNNIIRGGAGADTMNGGEGIDWVDYRGSSEAVNVNLSRSLQSGGDAQDDELSGFERIFGSTHGDTPTGDDGSNFIVGGAGNDTINGGGGNDIIRGGAGADDMDGGAGADWADYRDSSVGVNVNLATGQGSAGDAAGDTLTGIERIIGSSQNDTLTGDSRNNIIRGGEGADTLEGGDGIDWVDYRDSSNSVIVDLSKTVAQATHDVAVDVVGDSAGDVLSGFENIFGSSNIDILTGDLGDNIIRAGAGGDHLYYTGGNDILDGGEGNDNAYFGDTKSTDYDWSEYDADTETRLLTHLESGAEILLISIATADFSDGDAGVANGLGGFPFD